MEGAVVKTLLKKGPLFLFLCVGLAGPVAAGPPADGQAAYRSGNYATALRIIRPLADQGNVAAQSNHGAMFEHGSGVEQDCAEAVRWYRKAADVDSTNPRIDKNITKAFGDCMISEAKNGQYSSFDGGESALRLMGQCEDQWKAYVDACVQSGNTDGNCTLQSGILAQAVLKLLNK